MHSISKIFSVATVLCAGFSFLASNALGAPLATGKPKYLGGIYSGAPSNQEAGIPLYWNQVTPENAGKWGSVEGTRGVFNWTALDAAYNLAKSNGLPFRFHVLFWGAQQPAWMRDLSDAEQLAEINIWLAAVAGRYPDIDYLEVVNEAFHDQPDSTWKWLTYVDNTTDPNCGNYKKALGGNGITGWDWVLQAFRLARQYFPNTKLVLNDYGIISDGNATNNYVALINLLKAENLIDVIAEQAHAFNTSSASAPTLTNNLNTLGATGLPIWITEFDIDGGTSSAPNDAVQLLEYQRVFPLLWEHPSVIGITTWGYRPGLWRDAQGAFLVLANGTERSAMTWLKSYVAASNPNRLALISSHPSGQSVIGGANASFTIVATGNPAPTYQWQRLPVGGSWANLSNSGNYTNVTTATLSVSTTVGMSGDQFRCVATNSGGTATSNAVTLTVTAPPFTRNDFDGDGKADIFLSNTVTGDRAVWFMNGTAIATNAFAGTVPAEWTISATGDFNGDGKADIFWTNTSTGDRAMWLMNGSVNIGGGYLGAVPVAWVVSGTGDFDGDGKADVLWTNTATGERAMWLMNGSVLSSGASLGVVPVAWVVSGTGDFDGDGKADILLSNTSTGDRVIWFMNGGTISTNAFAGTVPVAWTISSTGDFNGDGKADIFWTNTATGDRAVWLMNGNTNSAGGYLGAIPVEWVVSSTGDYNGDGKSDIFWTNTATGDRSMWLMNGITTSAGASLGTVPVAWVTSN